ncbi:hypothetical protein FISHEDRAFT_77501 [Fistulina hepatica ATCC 64428]|uniref:Uncharacterized protein n=1 Tax=Fistulina hepatica ATCC 64428 TaxID=1128425 RepID=A0A0D7A340_9AGAR|nr:hypothetical protein FISHEDRAFT_77501 [Fistulina hepatica ATCC 64428]
MSTSCPLSEILPTISLLSAPCIQAAQTVKRLTVSAADRKDCTKANAEQQKELNAAIINIHKLITKHAAKIAEEYDVKKEKTAQSVARKNTSPLKANDFLSHCKIMIKLIKGMWCHTGIEGFFVVVSSDVGLTLNPYWYFFCPKLEDYMKIASQKWQTRHVGQLMQSFAMAGCDVLALSGCPTAKKCKFLKRDISLRINKVLIKVTGNPSASMEYIQYEPLSCPSTLGNAIGKLEKVCNALINKTCKFHKISAEEKKQRYC